MTSHALMAAPCDLGHPGWGDPWFPHRAVLFSSPFCMALFVFVVFLFVVLLWPYFDDTQDVIA